MSVIEKHVLPGTIEEVADLEGATPDHALSVVIPAYNEAGHVASQVHDVRAVMERTGWRFEIIVVDDGSTDGTASSAAAAGVRVIRHTKNRGYGAALQQGVAAAQFEWILIIDADGTYPSESIPELLARADRNAMVVGARIGRSVTIPTLRKPAKWFLGWLASYLAGRHLPDLNSGMRLMRKSLIERYKYLLPSGFSFTTSITLAAVCNDHPVEYVPIDYHARLGESKIRPRHAYDFALLILRTIVFFNPLKVFLPAGALLALSGLAKFIYDVFKQNLSESAIFAFLAALIIWAVGLLADQNARVAARR
jgi:glycosyltransferase involved in cell wall biosynthesis